MFRRSACSAIRAFALLASTSAIVGAQPLGKPGTLAQEIQLARKAGLPLTPAEMRLPQVPAARNAGPLYVQMLEATDRNPAWKPDLDLLEGPWEHHATDAPGLKARRAALQQIQPLLRLIHQAASRPGCRFERDWSQGSDLQFREFAAMRRAARILAAESLVLSASGQPTRAVSNAALTLRIADHAESEPLAMAYLVGFAAEASGLRAIERVLQAHPDRATTNAIRATLAAAPAAHPLHLSNHGEMVMYMTEIPKIRKEGIGRIRALTGGAKAEPTAPVSGLMVGVVDSMEAYVLWAQRQVTEALHRPYPEAMRRLEALDADIEARSARGDMTVMLAMIFMPGSTGLIRSATRGVACRGVLQAATQAVLSRAAGGAYPTALHQVPMDPFSGRPLVYRREGKGFVVYSVGETGRFTAAPGQPVGRETLFRME